MADSIDMGGSGVSRDVTQPVVGERWFRRRSGGHAVLRPSERLPRYWEVYWVGHPLYQRDWTRRTSMMHDADIEHHVRSGFYTEVTGLWVEDGL